MLIEHDSESNDYKTTLLVNDDNKLELEKLINKVLNPIVNEGKNGQRA